MVLKKKKTSINIFSEHPVGLLFYIQISFHTPLILQYMTDKFIYKTLFLIHEYSMSFRINIQRLGYMFVSYTNMRSNCLFTKKNSFMYIHFCVLTLHDKNIDFIIKEILCLFVQNKLSLKWEFILVTYTITFMHILQHASLKGHFPLTCILLVIFKS
jgi:hypothetical protein